MKKAEATRSREETVGEFLTRINIHNKEAEKNLIEAGYSNLDDLICGPPNVGDIDRFGFNVAQRNKILKSVSDLSKIEGELEIERPKKVTVLDRQEVSVLNVSNDGTFLKVNGLKLAGLSPMDSHILYLRSYAQKLIDHLDNNQFTIVEGPPGTGKSAITWLWACQQARATQKSLCWIHFNSLNTANCCELKDSKVNSFNVRDAPKHISYCVNDVLLVDGITKDHKTLLGSVVHWINENEKRKVIMVTSLQVHIKTEDADIVGITRFTLPSWELEEYENAILNEELVATIQDFLIDEGAEGLMSLEEDDSYMNPKEKLSYKYYYAGGSVRWMFSFTIDKVIKDIKTYIGRVQNIKALTGGLLGDRSEIAVNHLMMTNAQHNSFFISEYASRLLTEKSDLSFVQEASNTLLAKKNPTFDGWIFEFDFLTQLRLSSGKGVFLIDLDTKSKIFLPVIYRYLFYDVEEINVNWNLVANVWLIPERWNQGCYDSVQLLEDGGVRIIQVTRAESHSLKLKWVVLLLDAIENANYKVKSVEIGFVRPYNDLRKFKISQITGSWGKYKSIVKENRFMYGFVRAGDSY